MLDICCIGHITQDKVINKRTEMYMSGGTAFYFSHAMRNMDVKYALVTALADSEMQSVEDLRRLGIDVKALPSRHTVYFENIYDDDQDHRTQRVLAKADPFAIADLKDTEATIFHLGPLLADDISTDFIKELFSRANVSVDAQGFLREVIGQDVHAIDWADKLEALKYIDVLKVNDHELAVLAGVADIKKGAQILADWGVKEVVVTLGSKGSMILADGIFYAVAAYIPKQITDATGCGDTYMAGYLYRRIKGDDVPTAGQFASAMAALKIEQAGPFKGTEDEVKEMIKRK